MNEKQMIDKIDELIDKIDTDLEWKRGYGMTDGEVAIVIRTYELITNNNNE